MSWIKVGRSITLLVKPHPWVVSFEYQEGDEHMVGQELAGSKPWIVVPRKVGYQAPIAVSLMRTHPGAVLSLPSQALVSRDRGLALWNRMAGVATWICPLTPNQREEVYTEFSNVGRFRVYLMPLASLPGGVTQSSSRLPSGTAMWPQSRSAVPFGITFPHHPVLEFVCVEPRDLSVCVNIVEDASGTKSRQTHLDLGGVEVDVKFVLGQAWVMPSFATVRSIRINEQLGNPVTYMQKRGTIVQLLEQYRDRSADINVFCVKKYTPARPDRGIEADATRRLFLIEDDAAVGSFARGFARVLGVTQPEPFQENAHLGLTEILSMNEAAGRL